MFAGEATATTQPAQELADLFCSRASHLVHPLLQVIALAAKFLREQVVSIDIRDTKAYLQVQPEHSYSEAQAVGAVLDCQQNLFGV